MVDVLVFGSEDFSFDSGAVRLVSFLRERLPGCGVYRASGPEQLLESNNADFVIVDAARGIGKPVLITDLGRISYGNGRKVTAHDMDLAAFLKILGEVGKLKGVKIVAVPFDRDPDEFKDEVVRLVKSAVESCGRGV